MRLRPFPQSVKATILAAIAIATSIASNITPSQAAPPTRVIQAPGQPAVVIFGNQSQSFTIGCQAVRDLFSGQPTQKVSLQEYQQIISSPSARLAGNLGCNVPTTTNRGFITPTFTKAGYAGIIILNQIPFYVKNREFFTAMGLTPIVGSEISGNLLMLGNNREYLQRNAVIEAQVSLSPQNDSDSTKPTPAPPRGSISFTHRSDHQVYYTVTFDQAGTKQSFETSMGSGSGPSRISVFPIPNNATNIKIFGNYRGIRFENKVFFEKSVASAKDRVCITSTGSDTSQPPLVKDTCN